MFDLAAVRQMWANAWPVISLLVFCSILSGAIILERWVLLGGAAFDREELLGRLRKLLADRRREQAIAECEHLKKPVGRVLATLLNPPESLRAGGREPLERLADRQIRAITQDLSQYVTMLGTIGSVAPFVGLFGTVVGIIHAFKAIALTGSGGPAVVANGIAEALITTALGLFVAIPAVVAYNVFTRKVEHITENIELCADEIIDLAGSK